MKPWHRHLKRALWIAALCASVPVFYILSIGPAALIFDKFNLQGGLVGNALFMFYSPVESYMQNNRERFEVKLLEKYVKLWTGNGGRYSNCRIHAPASNARIRGRLHQRFLFLSRNHARIVGSIPVRANLVLIARIYERPEYHVKLARRFHGPIAMIVGNQLHRRSWCQATGQRIVIGVIDRPNIPNPFPSFFASHT
jgi:hypothetical protein